MTGSVTDAEQRSGVDTDRVNLVNLDISEWSNLVSLDISEGSNLVSLDISAESSSLVASLSDERSWSSLECPLSLLVSLSLSESSSEDFFSRLPPASVSGLVKMLSHVVVAAVVETLSLLLPAAMMCCPNEKMETRLVIWSISIVWGTPQPLSLRKAG